MKKLITSILALAMTASLAVIPTTASAESTTYFKYENDFSTQDAPGLDSTGAWDMENVGKWVTVKSSETNDVDQWSHDAETGVLRLGDNARPAFLFDKKIEEGKVHVSYYAKFKSQTKAYPYYYSGLIGAQYIDDDFTVTDDMVILSSHGDAKLVDTFMAWNMHTDTPKINVGVFDSNQTHASLVVNAAFDKWYKFDVVMEIKTDSTISADYYIDGVKNATMNSSAAQAPFYGMIFQTSSNFDDGEVLIDNFSIEHYTGAKEVTVKADKKELTAEQNSVTFTFSDYVDASVLTKENIVVTKDYKEYADYTVTDVTPKTVTIAGLNNDGVYNVTFSDKIAASAIGTFTNKSFIIPKGKLSGFSYKQDFAGDVATWNAENIGKWFNSSSVSFAHDAEYTGADGKAGVMKLASDARPVFAFDKAITDGTIHLSYKIKVDKATKNNAYYYSGLANETVMNGAAVDGNSITMSNYKYANLLDTFMMSGLQNDAPALCPGVIGNQYPDAGNGIAVSFDDWNRVDVIITKHPDGAYFAAYYINGMLKNTQQKSTISFPYYGFTMYPFNMGTGNVYIDDLVIAHSYNTAVISDADLSVPGKVKVTVPDTGVNTTSIRKVIVAGYNEGQFVNIGFSDFTLGRSKTYVDVDFDATGCDEIKVFLWDSFDNLKPLTNVYTKSLN